MFDRSQAVDRPRITDEAPGLRLATLKAANRLHISLYRQCLENEHVIMSKRDPNTWMWAEACQMLEQAERLHRQFFRLGTAGPRTAWEPPVDVFEDKDQFAIVVALPGVPAERIDVVIDGNSLIVRAQCEMPPMAGYVIQRMEIPHGYFERRIELPDIRMQLDPPRSLNGMLILNLRKLSARI
jgi:HSP20 family molecular chaperone IbpA